ncbi:MAG: RrF2 family transcriptional regulator [Candidatus Omnitrophota bacterium]
MKFTTKTEYGLVCLIHMARKGTGELATVKGIVKSEKFSPAYVEKILQKLKAAHIVKSHQGKEGGYSLARDPGKITLKDVVDALEGGTFDVYCRPKKRRDIVCTHHAGICGIKPIWWKTKELLDGFFDSVTIDTLANGRLEAGEVRHV